MANITKRGNGYRITVSMAFDGSGKRKRYTETYIPTAKSPKAVEKEVNHYAEVLEQKVKDGNVGFDGGSKFCDFTKNWYSDWAKYNLTLAQAERYKHDIELYAMPVIGQRRLSKIKKKDCQEIVNRMMENNLSTGTINRAVCSMTSVFKYALQLELINSLPYDRDRKLMIPKDTKDNSIHCFSVEQSQIFLNALKLNYPIEYGKRKRTDSEGNEYDIDGYTVEKPIPFQWQVYFTLALMAGLRKGEMLALTWEDIDFEECEISISKAIVKTKSLGQIVKEPKTTSGNRTVHVPQDCIRLLEEWHDIQKDMADLSIWEGKRGIDFEKNNVFIQSNGIRMDLYTPTSTFRKFLLKYNKYIDQLASKAKGKNKQLILSRKLPVIRLHDLRHCFATMLISEGVDIVTVSKVMGHAHPSITTDIYSHLLEKKNKEVADVFTRLFCQNNDVSLRS